MAKYCLKKQSKRVTCRKRHKIEKKVREHNKKLKREQKKKDVLVGKKNVKLISVPNKCPFKEEVLLEAEKKRLEIKEKQKQRKLDTTVLKKQLKEGGANIKVQKTDLNVELANWNGKPDYVVTATDLTTGVNASANKSMKVFAGEVRKTIEMADVVIEVLDARDPLGSRSARIEELVISQNKRLVLLLNKIDLVPRDNVAKWIAYLRKQLPTIAFKASTQNQNEKLGRYLTANLNSASSKCIGADLVMKLLGNYCRNKDIKTSIRVAVVGFPNVGKSSVINSLKRKKSCLTGSVPGLTRQLKEVELDKHIRLIDSPGVVLATKDEEFDPTEMALKNSIRVEALEDPIEPIIAILRRCSVKALMLHYTIPQFTGYEEFLALIARRLGRIKKGGRSDLTAAAKHVLIDWNTGKLRYYTEPPEENDFTKAILSSEIVATFSEEFNLDSLDDDLKLVIEGAPDSMETVETIYDPSIPIDNDENEETNDDESTDEMEHDGADENAADKKYRVVEGVKKKKKVRFVDEQSAINSLPSSLKIDGNVRLNHSIKVALKKHKKHKKKAALLTEKLANSLSDALGDTNMGYA